jgi:tetratricopeptide (TPR) repeat protein
MPKIIKKKVVQKKTVQDEEVAGFALDALDAAKGRQKQLLIVGLVIVAMLALYMAFSMYSSSLEADAVAIEKKANDYYYGEAVEGTMSDDERLKKALEIFKESVDIKVTRTALYNLGNTYYKMGDYANAIKQYDLFVNKFSGNVEMLALVYQKIAASYIRSGQKEKAFVALRKLEKIKSGIFKDTALLLEARYLESEGDLEKSLEKYAELAAEFPGSVWSGEAASKLPAPKVETEVKAEEKAVAAEKKEEGGEGQTAGEK